MKKIVGLLAVAVLFGAYGLSIFYKKINFFDLY